MSFRTRCPECGEGRTLADDREGRKVRCPECDKVFVAEPEPADEDEDSKDGPAARPAAAPGSAKKTSGQPPAKKPRDEPDDADEDRPRRPARDDDEEDRPRRKKKRKRDKAGSNKMILILAGGAAAVILIGVVLFFVLRGGGQKAGTPGAVVKTDVPAGTTPPPGEEGKTGEPKADNPAPVSLAADIPELGEVLPADKAPENAPMRPTKKMPFFKLSDLHMVSGSVGKGKGFFGQAGRLVVHYERIGPESSWSPNLILRTPDGVEHVITGFIPGLAGDYNIDIGFVGGPPKNLEAYLVQTDFRYGEEWRPRFKVSNSTVMGTMNIPPMLAREWKADEAEKLNNPPVSGPDANRNPGIGEDTPFIGWTESTKQTTRYVDATKKPVIGILYKVGEEDVDGTRLTVPRSLVPAYHLRQGRFGAQAVFAKEGYAVGALNVKLKKYVVAVQPVYMKLKADGRLDPADSYLERWIGQQESGEKDAKLGGDGRTVIGLSTRGAGAIHCASLVVD